MKKLLCLFFAVFIIASMTSCSNSKNNEQPDVKQIENIFQLATVECYFNNLATIDLPKGKGLTHLFEVDRKWWLEYEGTVKIGIDAEKVSIKTKENKITITMPHATILYEEYAKEGKPITNKDSWVNKNKITDKQQQNAIKDAQDKMVKNMEANKTLMERAEERAKLLIENYIKTIVTADGSKYEIEWQYIE